MKSQEFANSASVPYRRETFVNKKIVLDYDGDFNMADATSLSNDARAKSLTQINHFVDSIKHDYDSIGRAYYINDKMSFYYLPQVSKKDSITAVRRAAEVAYNVDSAYAKLPPEKKRMAANDALNKIQQHVTDLDFKSMITDDGDKLIRLH